MNLKAGNSEVIATSEIYATEAACMNGIESIRRNAVEAKLEDQAVEGYEAVTNPKFEVYTDKAGEFRFRLKAKNGEIIAVGEGYKTKASCLMASIRSVAMRRKHRWKRLKAEPVDLDTEAASEKRGGLFMDMCFRAGEAIALF